jgi:hypothetical protein
MLRVDFNDIRTTLQAYTLFMTTVTHCILMRMMKRLLHRGIWRRAMAIQLIINKN